MNWDPIDQTVLANEQVIDGARLPLRRADRKARNPDVLPAKITDYAEELLGEVDNGLPGWPERVRVMQSNWIGKSTPACVSRSRMTSKITDGKLIDDGKMWVFTDPCADTIMGVTFCAVAPEHALATHAAQSNPARLPPSSPNASSASVIEADMATMEKKGHAYRPVRPRIH